MVERLHSELTPALQSGRLEGMNVPDLLWTFCQQDRTGTLHVTQSDYSKTIYFENGQIVFAASSNNDDRLGHRLLRKGLITLDQLAEAVMQLGSGKRLGTLLVEAGNLTPEQLVDGVLSQVEEIVLDLFSWEEGEYRFNEGPLPTEEVITLGMKSGELLLKGIRTIRSFDRIRRSVGAPPACYQLASQWSELLEGMELSAREDQLLDRLREGAASVDAICHEVFLSNFEIYQTLWGLKILGVVVSCDTTCERTSEDFLKGTLEDTSFPDLLISLGRSQATGVLYVSRHSQERTFHLATGRCIFATSSDPEDGLVAYLLRRGVISLADREEMAKRLLSNKRVGTILRDMGVIDDADLREMVKQQIGEIVLDTFRWHDAFYEFVPGELPSNEEITLEMNLDRLVSEGLRRVISWDRVSSGCGSMDTRLRLTSTFLDVLDGIGAGPEEWQVITALREPMSLRELCSKLELGDFRVFQILWALKALGALEDIPKAESPGEEITEPQPSPQQTQVISRELVEECIVQSAEEEEPAQAPSPEVTQIIPREMVERSLAQSDPDFEPPSDLDGIIARFNNTQRLVFNAIRSEVGAGAANFIRSCCDQLSDEAPESLHDADLLDDGSWSAEDLKRAVMEKCIDDPWSEYEKLIAVELEVLRDHLGEARTLELQRKLEEFGTQTARPPE
jgi:hypothetical protein